MTAQTHDYSSMNPRKVDIGMNPCAVAFIIVWYSCLDY